METSDSRNAKFRGNAMSSTLIQLTKGVWTQITTTSKYGFIRHHQGNTKIVYVTAPSIVAGLDPSTAVMRDTIMGSQIIYEGVDKDDFVWAYAISSDAKIVVSDDNGEMLNLDADYFNGTAGMIVQPYTEANVKNGLQFYLRAAWPLSDTIGSGDSVYISFRTTTKKVIAKTRIVNSIGEELSIELFKSPTILPGNEGQLRAASNYNGVNPVASTVVIYKNVNLTGGSEGTPLDSEPEYYFGSSATGQRVANSIPEGRERLLPDDELFLIKITNTGSGAARMQYFLDWYEGEPDIPRA